MRKNPAFDPRLLRGDLHHFLNRRAGVLFLGVVAWEQQIAGLMFDPIDPQFFEQPRRERHQSFLLPFAASDSNHHPTRVDVLNPQAGCFGEPESRRIEDHQEGSVFEVRCALE